MAPQMASAIAAEMRGSVSKESDEAEGVVGGGGGAAWSCLLPRGLVRILQPPDKAQTTAVAVSTNLSSVSLIASSGPLKPMAPAPTTTPLQKRSRQ